MISQNGVETVGAAMRPDSAIDGDTFSASLRAPNSARHRGR